MIATPDYTAALWALRDFMQGNPKKLVKPHQEIVRAYYRDCKEAAKSGLTEAQVQLGILELRNSAKYKKTLDEHVRLVTRKNFERQKALRPQDHPLYTPEKGEPGTEVPMSMKMLDEKNYDLASAKTMAEKEVILANLRELSDMEYQEKLQEIEHERRRAESEQAYKAEFGQWTEENTEFCADCGRGGFRGHIKHSPRCGTRPGNAGRGAAVVPTSDAIDLAVDNPPIVVERIAKDVAEGI